MIEYRIINRPFGKFTVQWRDRWEPRLISKGFWFTRVSPNPAYGWHTLGMNGEHIVRNDTKKYFPSQLARFDTIGEAQLFLKWVKKSDDELVVE